MHFLIFVFYIVSHEKDAIIDVYIFFNKKIIILEISNSH